MKRVFCILVFCLIGALLPAKAQKSMSIAFYNVENLFDTSDRRNSFDDEFTPKGDLEWDASRLNAKLDRIAEVFLMIDKNLPDIIGLCEVENSFVLNLLVEHPKLKKANYRIIHFDSPDKRGIDNAILYKPEVLRLTAAYIYPVFLPTGETTRDLLFGEFIIKADKKQNSRLIFSVNHWPSRRGGDTSIMERIFTAQTLSHVVDSLHKTADERTNFVACGDFNDEPSDSSIQTLLKGGDYCLKNLSQSWQNSGQGTLVYRSNWFIFDQFMVNCSLTERKKGWTLSTDTAQIVTDNRLREQEGKFKGNPFRTYVGKKYLGGYSDHLPTFIRLTFK